MGDSDKQMRIISENLQKLLAAHDLNQSELARMVGVSESAVGKWILCKNAPTMGKIQQIANIFRVQLSDILEDKSEQQEQTPERRFLMDKLAKASDEEIDKMVKLWDFIENEINDN